MMPAPRHSLYGARQGDMSLSSPERQRGVRSNGRLVMMSIG
jgi:hypothetical protein